MFSKNPGDSVKFQPWLKQKKTRFIPNIFTLGNALFGFCSIIFAAEGEFVASAYCIFLGAMMDSLDGQIARLFRATSNFGLELDSLSDVVTFCLAPAFLIYCWQLHKFGLLGLLTSSLLLMFGILRLAKFNITASDQTHYFIGVPTPIVACFIAAIVLNFRGASVHFWGRMALGLVVVALSGFMISFVRVPTFKHIRKGWYAIAVAGFTCAAVVFGFVKMLLLIFAIYFLFVIYKIVYLSVANTLSRIFRKKLTQNSKHHLA